ncbi:PREDICTED: LOW QUALITY PROTEIN: sulfotransferase 4A1-like [Dufourea novaeangliae]|uniref:LOW QUALITY PROTEIN: sulfotransferase 4A1-like n=1 Tax=Dufourea novaeangliae TaxID=178035 RepID=UPI0007675B90|nr:PREDICTED: LOW QUALITY PROTEIN: sulfotransferase 4A1-like [Dufourea novaeangliae]
MARDPPKYELLNEKKTKEMLQIFTGERTGWVLVGPKKWFFPYRYTEQGEGFYNFKARPDDTWVVSYPRSGTTWTQELVWLLSNNLDFETARKKLLVERFPFLEFSMFNHPEVTLEFLEMNTGNKDKTDMCSSFAKPGYEVLTNIPSPRFIKSHFPFSLLPEILDSGCKVVYVARNPKDVAVSWYYWSKGIKTQGYLGDFAMFWNYFQNDLTSWSPYWEHLKEAWALRDHPNVLFMFYEEMQHDFPKAVKKVAKFLGKNYTEEQIGHVTDKECGIMTAGTFVRRGQSGGWRDMFTPDLDAKANEWMEQNLKDTDFVFPYFNNNTNNNCH